MTEYS